MKYFFVLGRNPVLSKQELFSFLNSRNIHFNELFFEYNYLVLDAEYVFNIEDFGGVISLGKLDFIGSEKDFEKYLNSQILVDDDKFNYSVSGNVEPDLLKRLFKNNKQKATLKHGRSKLKFQDGSSDMLSKTSHSFFLYFFENKIYFGKTSQVFDSKKIEFRDMNKPVRREELAISPRLSKILVNLSGAKTGNLLLDPFCGVGGILQEALLKGISVQGSDKDIKAIIGCKKNLAWLKKEFNFNARFFVEQKNVCNLFGRFDAIATESPFGDIVTKKMDNQKAKQFVLKFEQFIIVALKSMKQVKKNSAKIAITFPFVGKVKVNMQRVCDETGLRLVCAPIEEIKDKQFVGREIVVFE